jgi:peptidoglycan/LPS O-acetylase OafA/YrhL
VNNELRHKTIPFRPEVDGLRALAVVAVILHHTSFLPGGYLGVDVFFVVSGYLITSIILTELHRGTFSLVHFYERRIRRIMPAMLLVIVVTSLFAWLWMAPALMSSYAKSVVASVTSLSNFWFFWSTSYFGVSVDYTPLLHTWSLAIEEQFYLFFPALLLWWQRARGSNPSRMLVVVTIISFLLAVVTNIYSPRGMFYMMPMRLWELMVGSIIASMGLAVRARTLDKRLREICGWGGIVVIFVVIALPTVFVMPQIPSMLVSTLGTACVIVFSDSETHVGRLLGTRPFTFIGAISYSAYLWHQPVLVLARIQTLGALGSDVMMLLIGLIFVLAVLSWRFVEQPFRRRESLGTRRVVGIVGITSLALLGFGLTGVVTNGFAFRFPNPPRVAVESRTKELKEECLTRNRWWANSDLWSCRLGDTEAGQTPKIAVFGDSHVGSLLPALDEAARRRRTSFMVRAVPSCPPLIGIDVDRDRTARGRCIDEVRRQMEQATEMGVRDVILIARWSAYSGALGDQLPLRLIEAGEFALPLANDARARLESAMNATIAEYQRRGMRVHVVLQVPEQRSEPDWFFHRAMRGDLGAAESIDALVRTWSVSVAEYRAEQEGDRSMIQRVVQQEQVIDLAPYLCDDEKCPIGMGEQSYYLDANHLNELGSMRAVPGFEALFDQIAATSLYTRARFADASRQ